MKALSWLKNTRLEEQKQSQEADDRQQEQFTYTEPMQWLPSPFLFESSHFNFLAGVPFINIIIIIMEEYARLLVTKPTGDGEGLQPTRGARDTAKVGQGQVHVSQCRWGIRLSQAKKPGFSPIPPIPSPPQTCGGRESTVKRHPSKGPKTCDTLSTLTSSNWSEGKR